jgi:putative endonuclease
MQKNKALKDIGAIKKLDLVVKIEPKAVENKSKFREKPYFLYLLLCQGDVIYAGITTDVHRRYQEHCAGKGAKFTVSRPPQKLLCHALIGSRSQAQSAEYTVKQLKKSRKVAYVQSLTEAAENPVIV